MSSYSRRVGRLATKFTAALAAQSREVYWRFWKAEIARQEARFGPIVAAPPDVWQEAEAEQRYDNYALAKRYLIEEGHWPEG